MSGPSRRAWILSWGLHLCLILLLVFGPSLRPPPKVAKPIGNIIEAVMVDASMLGVTQRTLPKPVDEEKLRQDRIRAEQLRQDKEEEAREAKRQAELIALKEEQEKQKRLQEVQDEKDRKAQELQDKKEEAERVAEQKRKDALAEEKAEADARKKREEDKKEKERLAKEKAAKAKAEKERLAAIKKKKEAEAKAKAAAEAKRKAELAAQLKREQEARQQAMLDAMGVEEERVNAVNDGLLDQYIREITDKVTRKWQRPASAREGLECRVQARQIPGGVVTSVKVLECNGDDAVKRSIEAAVLKASPLPEPKHSSLFDRNLIFTFAPD